MFGKYFFCKWILVGHFAKDVFLFKKRPCLTKAAFLHSGLLYESSISIQKQPLFTKGPLALGTLRKMYFYSKEAHSLTKRPLLRATLRKQYFYSKSAPVYERPFSQKNPLTPYSIQPLQPLPCRQFFHQHLLKEQVQPLKNFCF